MGRSCAHCTLWADGFTGLIPYITERAAFALGYLVDGELWPGVSALHLNEDGTIVGTNKDVFGPLDDYNALWHFFSLLPGSKTLEQRSRETKRRGEQVDSPEQRRDERPHTVRDRRARFVLCSAHGSMA